MSRPSISLAMIVKNEAENIAQVLGSVIDCVDEIHITDTGSTDNTVEIAKSFGAKIHHFEWCDDFAKARNFSFSHVTTDFVLWLDADDVLENQQGFKNFRDTVMNLADYWIATYHYASDPAGNAVCSFARERVFRVNRGFQWKYPIHEGVLPNSGTMAPRIQITPAWSVRHKRTEADLLKDRSRNLDIFGKISKEGPLDARLRYYYGKEYFEAGKPAEAILFLGDALKEQSLEMHDRILAMQYICYAYVQTNQLEKAIEMAQAGLMLAPHRAEFYVIQGDCYLKAGKLFDSIPSYRAASSCQDVAPAGFSNAIFSHKDAYGPYPLNQIARVWANLGDLDRAESEAQICFDKFVSSEAKQILDELRKEKSARNGYKNAVPCRDIVITCPSHTPYAWNPEIAKTRSMGGSETATIEMAYHLHKISGRPVKVFNQTEEAKTFDGVEYIPNSKIPEYMAVHKPFLHIAWRHNYKMTDAATFLWCHDLVTQGAENHANYERILCLTPFHKRYVMAMQNIPEHKIWVTSNGLKPERFQDGPWTKDPMKFVFSSSPDRGLDRAMRVLDKVRLKYPHVHLHVAYGIEHLEKYGLGDLQKTLKSMMDERRDWVTYEGAMQQDDLMRLFKQSAYCVQPSDFIETSMISALERQACGVYQIIRAVGGAVDTLSDAVKHGEATLVESDCLTEIEYQKFVDATLEAIDREAYKGMRMNASDYSWEKVAQSWLEHLPKMSYPAAEMLSGTG